MPRRSKLGHEAQGKAGLANSKDELKRVRNRISQRAIREKRALRIQQLEQELAQTRHNDAEARFNELRAENNKLRNGLHATRKKFLSISTTTSSVADTIRTLLDLDPAKDELENAEISAPPETPNEELSTHSKLPQESPSTEEIIVEQHYGAKGLFPAQFGPALDLGDLAVRPGTSSDPKQPSETELWGRAEGLGEDSLMGQGDYLDPTPGPLRREAVVNTGHPFDEMLPNDGALRLSSKRSHSNISDHLEYIFKLLGLSGVSEHVSGAPALMHSLLHCVLQQCWPIMEHWFHVTESCDILKPVMWWQVTKSPQSFAEIPRGYTPTPAQLVLSYPCIIDWIPHPMIRNVMVTNYEMYDVDEVICDMTDAYVAEYEHNFPDRNVEPLSIVDMVQRYPYPGADRWTTPPYANSATGHLHPQSHFLQTHHIQSFKVDASFFVKYPGLYDATAIAERSCRSVRINERAEVSHRPLPFTAASANLYLDMIAQAKANAFR